MGKSLKKFRRKYLSFLPRGAEIHKKREQVLRMFGLASSHLPAYLIRHPELRVESPLAYIVAEHVVRNGKLRFLQIGAFDGKTCDDLRNVIDSYDCQGVLVEPQSGAFKSLEETYRDCSKVTLINAAIDEVSGERDFFMTSDEASLLSSFDRNHLLKHGVSASDIVVKKIPCLTINNVLEAAGMDGVDLIQIDAEGYDYEIIKSIDFSSINPAIIRFEIDHLSQQDLSACLGTLAEQGYRFFPENKDMIALKATNGAKSVGGNTQDDASNKSKVRSAA